MDAEEIIELLQLAPHPEGGRYRQTWRAAAEANQRAAGSAIYFLLRQGEVSHWHRVDAAETWHFYEGAPLELRIAADGAADEATDGATEEVLTLGPDLAVGQRPQLVVPPGAWQSARTLGDHTLVGCTVSPAFEFEGFELAAPGWSPATAR